MKKWMIWTVLIIIILASAGTLLGYKASTSQSHLTNTDEMSEKWAQIEQVDWSSTNDFLKELKKNDTITDVNVSFVNTMNFEESIKHQMGFTGGLNLHVRTPKDLTTVQRAEVGIEIVKVFFANEDVKEIALSVFEEGDDKRFIKMTANQSDFENQANEDVLSGLRRFSIVNGGYQQR